MATFKALPIWFGPMPLMLRGRRFSRRAMRDMIVGGVRVNRTAIRCPVLSFFGAMDHLVPLWQMRAEARRLRATVVEYPRAGRYLMENQWSERIADDIAAWISQSMVAAPLERLPNERAS